MKAKITRNTQYDSIFALLKLIRQFEIRSEFYPERWTKYTKLSKAQERKRRRMVYRGKL